MLSIWKSISNRNRKLTYSGGFFCAPFDGSLAGVPSHMNDHPTFFEAHFIHQRFHQPDATTMNGSGIFGSRRVRYLN
jgi:hypothetical protein